MKRLKTNSTISKAIGYVLLLLVDIHISLNLSSNDSINRRNKHIYIMYHYVRGVINIREVKLRYCPTTEIPAHLFTKALRRLLLEQFVRICGL